MRPWWERRPETYLEELEAFEARGLKFVEDEAAKESGRLVLNGSVAIRAGEETRIIVVYPETFPLTRFNIFAPDLRLQRHQNPFLGAIFAFSRRDGNSGGPATELQTSLQPRFHVSFG